MNLSWIWVGLGGFAGSIGRYAVGLWLGPLITQWPAATLAVNFIGSFILGLLITSSQQRALPASVMLLAGTGFCGGFTTFSTFTVENILLLQEGRLLTFFGYTSASLLLGLLGAFLGILAGRLFQ